MLYPESTGIKPAQSMKRNVTADSMNITTVAVDTDDDELYDDDLKNMTNSTDIKKGKIEWNGFLVTCLSLKSKNMGIVTFSITSDTLLNLLGMIILYIYTMY